MHADLRRIDREPQSLVRGHAGKIAAQLLEQRRHVEVGELELDGAGFELADVEQRIQQSRHRVDGLFLLAQHLAAFLVADHAPQRAVEQAERLQRLAQIVARRGEKAALGEIGVFGFAARFLERLFGLLALGDVADRRGHHDFAALLDRAQADLDRELGAVLAHAEKLETHAHGPHAHVVRVALRWPTWRARNRSGSSTSTRTADQSPSAA